MKREITSVVKLRDEWHGASFLLDKNSVKNVKIYNNINPYNSTNIRSNVPVYASLETSSSYFVHLKFPFTGKRRIELVLNGELSNILPVEINNVVVDFKEIGKGNVLAVALPKEDTVGLKTVKNIKGITVNAIATLHALKWLNSIPQNDFVFIYIDGNNATVIAQRKGNLHYLRQFYYSKENTANLYAAISEIKEENEFISVPYYIVSIFGDGDVKTLKEDIEKKYNIKINTPSLQQHITTDGYPNWLWAAIGASLITVDSNEINLLHQKEKGMGLSHEILFKWLGGLAALSTLIFIMFFLNLHFKEKTYRFFATEQQNIYKTVFPKSPPIKDVVSVFRDKISIIDRELVGAGTINTAPALKILAEISAKIDKQIDVKLNEFVCDENELSISGTTVSFMAVEKIKAAMEEIRDIKNIEIQNLDMTQGKQIKFKIKGKF